MESTINYSSRLCDIHAQAFTPSTLLIPKKLLSYFDTRVKIFGNRRIYFKHLIITYGRDLNRFGLHPVSPKWKKKYQENGLNLQPRNFKPDPEFWEEFRHISLAYGLAMCHLFVILLKLEHDRWIQAGKPEKFCEKFPLQLPIDNSSMNSKVFYRKHEVFSLETLAMGHDHTILLRNIDFKELKLDRITMIKH